MSAYTVGIWFIGRFLVLLNTNLLKVLFFGMYRLNFKHIMLACVNFYKKTYPVVQKCCVKSSLQFTCVEFKFLPLDAMCKRGLCCRPVSVCPSVTLVDFIKTAEDIAKFLSRPISPIILVFVPSASTQFQGEPLQQGRKIHGGEKILRFSTEIAVYIGNGTR